MKKGFLYWLRASLEGSDNRASSKMLILLWAVVLVTILHVLFIYLSIRIADKVIPTEASLKVMDRVRDLISIDWTVIAVLVGVATIQTIIQLFRIIRGQSEPNPQPGDTIDVTVTGTIPKEQKEGE